MSIPPTRVQLTQFLAGLPPSVWTAYADQLHELVCVELGDGPEPAHRLAHAEVEYLTGERRVQPKAAWIAAADADAVRLLVEQDALALRAAFAPPRLVRTPAHISDAVIAKARRAGRVFHG